MVKRHSQSLAEMQAERPWTAAEKQVIEEARTSEVVLGSGAVPDAQSDQVEVRAGLIRHLVLGGCDGAPVPDKGVRIIGAWVVDVLDLRGCESTQDLRLGGCRLVETPILMDARLGGVYLPGCHVPGLNAHRLRVTRSVLLNQKFTATGPVDLSGARIGGQLTCVNGRFDGAGRVALQGSAMEVGADVFLSDGFHATGEVNLTRARIGGQLACDGGRFDDAGGVALDGDALEVAADVFMRDGFHATGQVKLVRAQITGHLICKGGKFEDGFDGEGMHVGAGFFWERVADLTGPLDLTDAEVGRLHDDAQSWAGAKPLLLSGFRYARLSGDMTVAQRLAWLGAKDERDLIVSEDGGQAPASVQKVGERLQEPEATQCDAQPYTQLAKVLREQGRAQAAARVLEERDKRVREAQYQAALRGLGPGWRGTYALITTLIAKAWGWLFGWLFGYGHMPGKALIKVFVLIFATFLLYGQVWRAGQFAPNSDVVLTSEAWVSAVHAGCPATSDADYDAWRGQCAMPLEIWQKTESAKDYETFSAGLYALDLFVPLDALGQESAWAPSRERGLWGALGYWMRMPVQMAGWIITAVGAAALTGLVGRKD